MPFYAVAKGFKPGVYESWDECLKQVVNFEGVKFKMFHSKYEAMQYVENNGGSKPAQDNNMQGMGPSEGAAIQPKSINVPRKRKASIIQENELPSTSNISGRPNISFKYDKDGFVRVYTRGKCDNDGEPNTTGRIIVFFGEEHHLNVWEPCNGTTNMCAEIRATTKAVRILKRHGEYKACIYTLCQLLVNAFTCWANDRWKREASTFSKGILMENERYLKELDQEIVNMNIKWTYVEDISDVIGNEMAARLARNGTEL
ncbi:ribonuclease H1-like [Ctenocephalides felis]|uniref:ribonuclease H1-like n=1 Tax=Ctenocephalides felis TaxID=7515 RepID=UPI000E6E16DD|nr:ribonuclease H1-like [Ctenocephalides felis]